MSARVSALASALPVVDSQPQRHVSATEWLENLPTEPPRGLYVHVPFCVHKCHYCDFYSITRQTDERMRQYVDLVLAEANFWSEAGVETDLHTVFFGGGTPSLLPARGMARLLAGLRERLDLSQIDEWTCEVNPATAGNDYLSLMHAGGVNRISFGAQSFDRRELATLERHHDPTDVPAAVDMARAAGFSRISLDLIYAIPGQSIGDWHRSLDRALEIGVDHLSCYGLTYEPNTPLAVRRRLGRVNAIDDDVEVEMFRQTRRHLAAVGMPAYEVSNYARSGQESRHNLGYWRGEGYIGLGPSAASHVGGVRWRNAPHIGHWESAIASRLLPAIDSERLDRDKRAAELAWLNLRLTAGIDVVDYRRRTGRDVRQTFSDVLVQMTMAGLLEDVGTHLRLTDAGWPVADAVAAEFLAVR